MAINMRTFKILLKAGLIQGANISEIGKQILKDNQRKRK